MLHQTISVNIAVRVIDNVFKKLNIELKEYHKSILTILIPSVIYRDGSIIILSETIRQVNKIFKKHNEKYDLINILLAIDCISSIDKYGAVTIPLAWLLNKLTVNKETINKSKTDILKKKVLTNATQTILISELLTHIGLPKMVSIPVVNIILELFYTDINTEQKAMVNTNTAFKGYKMSEVRNVLKQMQLEKVFLSTAILLVITHIGFKISTSLILVNVLSELLDVIKVEYKSRRIKSFLN